MLSKLFALRYPVLIGVLILCGLLTPALIRGLEMNNALDVWFMEDAPTLQVYNDFQDRFGSDEVVVVIYRQEDGVINPATLQRVKSLTDSLAAHKDVDAVFSLANVQILERTPIGMRASMLLDAKEQIEDRLDAYPWLSEQFLNNDRTATRLLVQLSDAPDLDSRRGQIINSLRSLTTSVIEDKDYAFGGIGVIFEGLNEVSQKEFGKYLAIAYLAMFLLLTVLYRNAWVVVLALGVITLSSYVTLGLYGLAGLRLNLMSTLIPIILALLGLIDVIHIVNERVHLGEANGDAKEKALNALRSVWKPCLFTTLTTMAGFLSLLFTPMPILREFGLFTAIGVFFCLLFTYLLGIFFLPLVKDLSGFKVSTDTLWHRMEKRKWVFGGIAIVASILALLGLPRITVDTYTMGYLPEDHRVVEDHEAILSWWGDYMPLDYLIKVEDSVSLFSPEVIERGLALTEAWTAKDEADGAMSYPALTKAGIEARYGERAERAMQSESALQGMERLMKNYYPNLHSYMVDSAGEYGRITLFGDMASAQELKVLMNDLNAIADTTLGETATAIPAGYLPMYADIINFVTASQVQSLSLALVLIFLIVLIYLREPRLALIALLCNLFPVLVFFGVVGWLRIDLDLATASIAAIGLSFCIDDSIHFIHEYWKSRRSGMSVKVAQQRTFTRIGSAILVSSIVLFFGYSLMSFSQLRTVYLFGALTALMVVSALFAQLVIFPALITWLDKENKKETA